jgi:hypothetical protein
MDAKRESLPQDGRQDDIRSAEFELIEQFQQCVLMIVVAKSIESDRIFISSKPNIMRRFDRSAYGKPPGPEYM